jgi:hypothetical protein
MEYDVDPIAAVTARQSLFAKIAGQGWAVAGAHLPFPGFGHIRTDGSSFAYVPVEYAPYP